jgi:predicted NBD/HSP70 family sugar kinase
LGEAAPEDPYAYADELLRQPVTPVVEQAVSRIAEALGAGIAGLVNAHDPAVITLGGLAVPLRAAAPAVFAAAYEDNLMTFHRSTPPPVLDAAHPTDGVLRGAGALGLDHLTSEAALTAWEAGRG